METLQRELQTKEDNVLVGRMNFETDDEHTMIT
jgi:hypothetical protein